MRLFISVCCLFTSFSLLFGQASPQQVDSLEQLVEKETHVGTKIILLGQLLSLHARSDLDKALGYAHQTLSLIAQANDGSQDHNKSQAQVLNTIGSLYAYQGKYKQALLWFDSSLTFSFAINDSAQVGNTYSNIGSIYTAQQKQTKALEYIYKAMDINEAIRDSSQVTFALNALLHIYIDKEEYDKAIQIGTKINNYRRFCEPYDWVINSLNMGMAHHGKNQPEAALSYIHTASQLALSYQFKELEVISYRELARIHADENRQDSALYYADKVLNNIRNFSEFQLGIAYLTIANIYAQYDQPKESIKLYEKSLEYAMTYHFTRSIKDNYKGLANVYATLGDHKKAYEYQSQMIVLKDSLLNETKQKQIEELEIQYETTKKEQSNQLLRKERDIEKLKVERGQYWILGLGLLLLVGLIVSYSILRTNQAKEEQKNTQLKHQLLRNQMNPHFIFNALIAIQSFMYKNDLKDASRYLSSFAKLVRAILENSRNEYITLDKEVQWLENYMSLQLLRFDNKFEYEIELEEELDSYGCLIPPMLTQPFIENALEHGLKSIDYKGQIKVRIYQQGSFLKVEVEDNGVGLEQAAKVTRNKEHKSLATTITQERLSFLNKNNQGKIAIEVQNVEPSGTIIAFTVPIKRL
ncbi:MAG: tetratricopeptide repeat-containing sensor histidine kinase [Aureispira sp.]